MMNFQTDVPADGTFIAGYRQEPEEHEETLVTSPGEGREFEGTVFIIHRSAVPSVSRERSGTRTAEEFRESGEPHALEATVSVGDDPMSRARDARVALMARKYEGASTTEDIARIEILTQRLRRLSPRVTPEDIEVVSGMVDQLEGISSNLEAVRAKFKLR